MEIQSCSGSNPGPLPVPLYLLGALQAAAAGTPRALSTYPRGALTGWGTLTAPPYGTRQAKLQSKEKLGGGEGQRLQCPAGALWVKRGSWEFVSLASVCGKLREFVSLASPSLDLLLARPWPFPVSLHRF